jgi:dTMP kinase
LREPGGTKVGEDIRRILLSPENNKISREVEMLLYMSARGQLIHEVIQPKLKAGFIVLCDRFLDSTLAYQGYGCGMDLDEIEAAGNLVLKGISPDLTILLDMKIEDALKRSGRNDRIEKRPLSYHRKVRHGYLALARRFPERIKVVQGDNNITKTRDEIRRIVLNVLERAHRSG